MSAGKKENFDKIITLYKQGYSSKNICEICNISSLTVRTCLQKAGFDTRNYRKASNSNKEKVVLLVRAGYSYKQIEKLLHVSTHLIREIILQAGLIGFAPKYHHPIELQIDKNKISLTAIDELNNLYLSGRYGLAKCASKLNITNEEFLWFVFHLTEIDQNKHYKKICININTMSKKDLPITAIAKTMDISPSIIKKIISQRTV